MAIESLLIQLADVVAKIENVRSLLGEEDLLGGPPAALTADDRAHINALLGRLNEKRAQLEAELRSMTKQG